MKHYFRILFFSLMVPLFLVAGNGANAITDLECKRRIITAMENAAAIGADEEKWARNAAAHCGRSITVDEEKGSLIGWIVGLMAFGFFYILYLLFFPRNREEQEFEDSFKGNQRALAYLDQSQISKLTVEEIAARSGAETSVVKAALWSFAYSCADYDGKELRRISEL